MTMLCKCRRDGGRGKMSKTERPILFQGPMVRAIRLLLKAMTRRVMFPQPSDSPASFISLTKPFGRWASNTGETIDCPFGSPGHRLWVRETWQAIHDTWCHEYPMDIDRDYPNKIPAQKGHWTAVYAAEWEGESIEDRGFPWRPGIHMPRWVCRTLLEISNLKVERVAEISPEDVALEGVPPEWGLALAVFGPGLEKEWTQARWEYAEPLDRWRWLWNKINAKPKPIPGGGRKARLLGLDGAKGEIAGYVSYPLEEKDRDPREEINGKPHICFPNPWVWVVRFREAA